MDKQVIWVYVLCYNESYFVNNFLTAYKEAAKIIVYDNHSTDDSVKRLKKDDRVEIRYFDSNKQVRDDMYLDIKNNCWKEARGIADWVIIVDFDEVFNRCVKTPDGVVLDLDLSVPYKDGFNIIRPCGFNMITATAPLYTDDHPYVHSKKGTYHEPENKMCCFRPEQLSEINFDAGCHHASPLDMNGGTDDIRILISGDYKMLHFISWDYEISKRKAKDRQERLSEINKKHGWGFQYEFTEEEHRNMYFIGVSLAEDIFNIKI